MFYKTGGAIGNGQSKDTEARTQNFLEWVRILVGEGFGGCLDAQSGTGQIPVRGPGGKAPRKRKRNRKNEG